jgi:hypothetical protein
LLYQVALRRPQTSEEATTALRQLLSKPRMTTADDHILIKEPDTVLMDCLHQRLRHLGFLTDGGSSTTIAKLPITALVALIADLVPATEQAAIRSTLRETGIAADDFQSLFVGALG